MLIPLSREPAGQEASLFVALSMQPSFRLQGPLLVMESCHELRSALETGNHDSYFL